MLMSHGGRIKLFEEMTVDYTVDVVDVQAQEELHDWYENQREYCEACGGVTYLSTQAECFMCRGGVN